MRLIRHLESLLQRKDLPRKNENSAPVTNPMRNSDTPYLCSEQIDVIENLLPRRWATNDVAVRADGERIRQLAFSGQVAWNIPIKGRRHLQFQTVRFVRIQHNHLLPKSLRIKRIVLTLLSLALLSRAATPAG